MKRPKISVIVPIYNVEPYIRECVDSILNQTYGDFELILVDDGSPDGCPKICDEYAKLDKRIVVIHKENGGLSSARNAGLDIAKGEYISFVDGDDYIDENHLMVCINEFKKNNCDLVKFRFQSFEDGASKPKIISKKNPEKMVFEINSKERKLSFIVDTLLSYKIGWETWSSFYKSSIIKKNDLLFEDNKKIFAEDIYFSTVYSLCCKRILFLDTPLYFYRKRKGSIMNTLNSYKMNEINELSKTLKEKEKKYGIDPFHYFIHNKLLLDRFYYLPKLNSIKNIIILRRELDKIDDYVFFKSNVQLFLDYSIKNHLIQKKSHEYILYKFLINKNCCTCSLRLLLNKIRRIIYAKN